MLRLIATTALWMALLSMTIQAAPADKLASAHREFAADHIYAADALLQEVIDDAASSQLQVEEALFLQTIIYYGDVLGAMAVIEPLAAASEQGSGYKEEVSRQLLLARRAFHAAASRYLTATVLGSKLETVKVDLPAFSEEDFSLIQATLRDKTELQNILGEYATDSSVGKGLLAKSSRLGLYTGFGRMLPPESSRKLASIRSQFGKGSVFTPIMYMDFIAEISLEMAKLVKEPNGPDLPGLAQRADERIIKLAGDNPQNLYVRNAGKRKASYQKLGKEN